MQARQPERTEPSAAAGRGRGTVAAWALLAVLLSATLLAFFQSWNSRQSAAERELEEQADIVEAGIEEGIHRYEDLVTRITGEAGPDGTFDREQFLDAVDEERLGVTLPGTYAVLVTESVAPDDLAAFEKTLIDPKYGGLLLKDADLGPPDGDYQIGVHAAPAALRSGAVGVDGRFYAPADEALPRAVRSGEPALSEPLPQTTFEITPSSLDDKDLVVLTNPLYDTPIVPKTPAERSAALAGAVSVAFYPDVLIDVARGAGASDIAVSLSEGDDEPAFAASTASLADEGPREGLTATRTIEAAGRTWVADFRALGGFSAPSGPSPWLVLGGGLLVSFLLFGFVYALARSRAHALEAVRDATSSLSAAAALFRTAFENAAIGMVLLADDGTVLRVNRSACSLLGRAGHDMVGSPIDDLLPHEDSVMGDETTHRLLAGEIDTAPLKRRFDLPDGSVVWTALALSLIPGVDPQSSFIVGQIDDITERHALEAQLAHQATHDPLTGLPNRALFMDRLEVVLARRTRDGATPAVMFVDLDHFKAINDRWGHAAGDNVLAAVAERFRRALRASDTVARYGGDEFTVLCEDVDQDQVLTVAQKLCNALTTPVTLADGEAVVGVSIGVVLADDLEDTAETLVREADGAMYEAKQEGRNRIHVVVGEDLVVESGDHPDAVTPAFRPELGADR
ncbi:MAG: diguanylate cyclase [Acidimicrobiia bacterium]